MKIKVLHVTQSLGGVKTYIEGVIKHADHTKFQYVIIAQEHLEFQEFCRKHNVDYQPIKLQRSINPFKDISALFKVISLIRKIGPDVIHTHSAKGGFIGRLAAKITGVKVIYAPHAFSYLSFKGVKRVIFYSLECIAKKWTDVLLSVSYSEANRAIYEVGYEQDCVKTILNSVSVEEFTPFRNYSDCFNVGMIGRLTYQKNPLLFLEVAGAIIKKNPFIKFSILGAGLCDHLADEMEKFLVDNNLKDKIEILPWGENDTSKNFLRATDIFVMTSVFEGLPYSLIEAMAQGIPCVASKVDGNTDVINNNENGYSCLGHIEFQNKIETLIANEGLRRKFGQAGYRHVKENHEIQAATKLLESLYETLYLRDKNDDRNLTLVNFDTINDQNVSKKAEAAPSVLITNQAV